MKLYEAKYSGWYLTYIVEKRGRKLYINLMYDRLSWIDTFDRDHCQEWNINLFIKDRDAVRYECNERGPSDDYVIFHHHLMGNKI